MNKNIIFVVLMISVFALLYFLSEKDYIPYPSDEDHIQITSEDSCVPCHSDDGEYPRKEDHPPKERCFLCHKEGSIAPGPADD